MLKLMWQKIVLNERERERERERDILLWHMERVDRFLGSSVDVKMSLGLSFPLNPPGPANVYVVGGMYKSR